MVKLKVDFKFYVIKYFVFLFVLSVMWMCALFVLSVLWMCALLFVLSVLWMCALLFVITLCCLVMQQGGRNV